MTDDRFAPELILAALNAHDVRYVVVGGFAVAAYGVIRATDDLDLVIEPDWANAGRLAKALESIDAADREETRDAISQDALVRNANRKLETRHGELHLLSEVDGVPTYHDLQPAEVIDLEGEHVPVASLADLRAIEADERSSQGSDDLAELDALADD